MIEDILTELLSIRTELDNLSERIRDVEDLIDEVY